MLTHVVNSTHAALRVCVFTGSQKRKGTHLLVTVVVLTERFISIKKVGVVFRIMGGWLFNSTHTPYLTPGRKKIGGVCPKPIIKRGESMQLDTGAAETTLKR